MGGGVHHGDEMRPITALFADIVGSTGLEERLGPDEVKALVGECVTRMSRAVEDFGGVIQAYMGDGICAYFGVPVAHEDDPERAARAALRIVEVGAAYAVEVEAAWGIEHFDVRVGLNSGPAAVGAVGRDFEQLVALGDTTNVAARLQSAAGHGTIAVGPGTTSRLSERFVLEPLGEIPVKGRREPVPASRLIGPRPTSEPRPPTPLVGRDRELRALGACIDDLEAGRGQVLLIVGEAGLGKTRMLSELRAIVGDRATWLEGRCASHGADVPYGPFMKALRTWLGVVEDDAQVVVRTKLRARAEALLGQRSERVVPYLGLMLAVRLDPAFERELLTLSADELAERMRRAYVAWAESLASTRPLVVAIDDLNWMDRTTRELAEQLVPLTDRSSFLLAAALRPDPGSEAWAYRLKLQAEYAHRVLEVPLPPIATEAARELVDALVAPGLIGDADRNEVVAKAEGNPLFLEELLRALLEAGGGRRTTWTIKAGAAADLPPALESLLVARIDRLAPGPRRLAQVAAVVGREFPVSVATAVAESAHPDVDIAALLRAEIVREISRFPELVCTFRHGLLQEAALSTLTSRTLRELYARVGNLMEERVADQIDEAAEQLAFYFYRSDLQTKALSYLERAAKRAPDPAHALELLRRAEKVAGRIEDAAAASKIRARIRELNRSA